MSSSEPKFLIRWVVSSFGLFLASALLGDQSVSYDGRFSAVIAAGLVLALINTFIRPLLVFFTLPAVLLSLGIFMAVINAVTVLIAAKWYGPLYIDGFGAAIVTGLVIGLVNWLVSAILEEKK